MGSFPVSVQALLRGELASDRALEDPLRTILLNAQNKSPDTHPDPFSIVSRVSVRDSAAGQPAATIPLPSPESATTTAILTNPRNNACTLTGNDPSPSSDVQLDLAPLPLADSLQA